MKKLLLALTAVAAFTGTASAADLAARPYTKAPPMPVAPSWTGFYIFGGGGGGVWDANSAQSRTTGGGLLLCTNNEAGWRRLVRHGRRWL